MDESNDGLSGAYVMSHDDVIKMNERFLRRQDCSDGKHEKYVEPFSKGNFVPTLKMLGVAEENPIFHIVNVCKHCRCLFVGSENGRE